MLSYKNIYTLPFKFEIPNYIKEFLNNRSTIVTWIKFSKRFLFIVFKGQKNLEVFSILPKHQSILWINVSAPSFGDTLMDLSSRVLLRDRKLDLFVNKKNAQIYLDDNIFNNVYSSEASIRDKKYDLVIIDSYSTRSLNIKSKVMPKTNFVGMFGYFNGPEVNRVLFSFHKMNHLIGYSQSEKNINNSAKASMSFNSQDEELVTRIGLPKKFIAIVLGGEWDYRIYKHWDKVIKKILLNNNQVNIALIGSKNGLSYVEKILPSFPKNNIINCVAKYSFNQTALIVAKAEILLCCDGGLMHAANSVGTIIVPLFARLEPKMQLTSANVAFPLFDEEDVNDISAENVIQEYCKALKYADNHPQI